jgi:K+-sensing histidine kinase KdpD
LNLDYNAETKQLVGRVKDTGIGISPENRTSLFKILGKVLKKKRPEFTSGIGLGLHICR